MKNFSSKGTLTIPLERMSQQGRAYSFIVIEYIQVPRHSNSVKSLYKLAYNLLSRHHAVYELIVTTSSDKKYEKKITSTKSKRFEDTELTVISGTEECELNISVRRHYFDEIANEYIYLELMNKRVSINCNSSVPGGLVRVKPNHY